MERNLQIQEELEQISPRLASVPFVATYWLSNDYFQKLPLFIQGKIASSTYVVPNGYFDNLSAIILATIKNVEKDELPAIFSNISKENVYTAPKEYFKKAIATTNAAPIVSITKNKTRRKWYLYTAAACITAILAFSAVQLITKDNPKADVSIAVGDTKVTYKQLKELNVEAAIDSLSTQDVDNYLCDNGLIACNDKKSVKPNEEAEITEEDIDAFLEGK